MKEKAGFCLGVREAILSLLRPRIEGERISETLGLPAILLVFPEFSPFAREMKGLIITGHRVDHCFDEGPFERNDIFPPNVYALKNFCSQLREKMPPVITKNIEGFLIQGITVEDYFCSHPPNSPSEISFYRELINAIWVRMVVSFGLALTGKELIL